MTANVSRPRKKRRPRDSQILQQSNGNRILHTLQKPIGITTAPRKKSATDSDKMKISGGRKRFRLRNILMKRKLTTHICCEKGPERVKSGIFAFPNQNAD